MVSRSSASAQTVHLRHTQIHIFHRLSLRSSFLTIRGLRHDFLPGLSEAARRVLSNQRVR